MKLRGEKHLIQCHCILPQYRNSKDPVFHKFTVFSVIDESDTVTPKYANCNNCGAVHKVYDICKSEIVTGADEMRSTLSVDDFKFSLPQQLYELMKEYQKELSDFEHAQFIIDNKLWNEKIVLSREEVDNHIQGKILKIVEKERFRIESYVHNLGF